MVSYYAILPVGVTLMVPPSHSHQLATKAVVVDVWTCVLPVRYLFLVHVAYVQCVLSPEGFHQAGSAEVVTRHAVLSIGVTRLVRSPHPTRLPESAHCLLCRQPYDTVVSGSSDVGLMKTIPFSVEGGRVYHLSNPCVSNTSLSKLNLHAIYIRCGYYAIRRRRKVHVRHGSP